LPDPLPRAGEYPELVQLLAALALPLGKTRILELAREVGLKAADGRAYVAATLQSELQDHVRRRTLVVTDRGYQCAAARRHAAFREAALSPRLASWAEPLLRALGAPTKESLWYVRPTLEQVVAMARIGLCGRLPPKRLAELFGALRIEEPAYVYWAALGDPFDAALIDLVPAADRDLLVERILAYSLHRPVESSAHAVEWAARRASDRGAHPALTGRAVEHLLYQGRFVQAESLLARIEGSSPQALRGAAAAMQGDAAEALKHFERAYEELAAADRESGHASGATPAAAARASGSSRPRKRTTAYGRLPPPVTWLYAASMLLADEPARLEKLRRYCRGEARASGGAIWDRLESAAAVRLGDRKAETLFVPINGHDAFGDLVAVEVSAWVKRRLEERVQPIVSHWIERCRGAGYEWMAREFEAGLAIGIGHEPTTGREPTAGGASMRDTAAPHGAALAAAFLHETPWRRAVKALAALGEARAAEEKATRIAWVIDPDSPSGTLQIEPWEQQRGARGWSRGKRAPLSRLAKSAQLDARDAQVCRALERISGNTFYLRVNQALPALIGHPHVFFASDLDTPIELVAADPQLHLERRADGGLRLSLPPELRAAMEEAEDDAGIDRSADAAWSSDARAAPGSTTDLCVLVRTSATRASVLRVTAAHRRAIELIGAQLDVPEAGAEELKHAVGAVAHLFEVHSEVESAVPEVAADATIRAELAPAGTGLRLRLAVRPFGEDGPRYAPGEGGARVLAHIKGERRGAVRDLAAERRGVERVSEAVAGFGVEQDALEWRFEDPEHCLAVVEALQGLGDGVRVEWPAGVSFRVTQPQRIENLRLAVHAERDWFTASGGLTLDDGTVIEMRRLIEFARQSRGRFVPLGEAGFLSLTEDLRRRLEELAALSEADAAHGAAARGAGERDAGAIRFPRAAAALVADTVNGAQLEASADWRALLGRMRAAETLDVQVPSTLQAELRPYQLEGFRWLARAAESGAGVCLADDMGLGKTVQALALLLRRAAQGPALVVAPTSVCSNWVEEAQRFAPTLAVRPFVGADRAGLVERAGPFDVLVCSYALLQQESERFASRNWHTVVLDEAQAVKNFAAKRTQSVLSLQADFRFATTGTPVENRLEELWTLFRFLNPGLLGSRERFQERFVTAIERRQDAHVRAQLKRIVRPFVLRRLKSEVLDELPPRTEITLAIEPDAAEEAFREALRQSALAAISDEKAPPESRRFRVLAELMRLRRACCDPSLVAPEAGVAGAKLDAFTELAAGLAANRHKALVFSQFVDFLALLRARLEERTLPYQYLDGSTPAAERTRRIAAFQRGEGDFFLISLRAGGFGLNLTAADYVIITDPWWNPAVEDQAAGRAHRMGQQRPVTVYRLVVKRSIEERIMEMHRDKRALTEGLFSGEAFGETLSVEDLIGLLRAG
jgi:superfamily II DNA or RNA helicase